ncbi:MMPL family transporter [Luteimicrobium sp. DT211]|uniref:MMPL family transporter n=1 Tax=Luteimicrobium sp. DT211 TaxID=3393412 RepID=UPI003CEAE566
MFASLGRAVSRHPLRAVAAWVVVAALSYLVAVAGLGSDGGLFDRVTSGEPQVSGSESATGLALIDSSSEQAVSITAIVDDAPPTTKGLATALGPLHDDLAGTDGVDTVIDPFVLPDGPTSDAAKPLIGKDGQGFIVVVDLKASLNDTRTSAAEDAVVARLRELPADLASVAPDATVRVSSDDLVVHAITDQLEADLRTGEAIALPVALVIMVLVFGGLLAASMPIVGALASIGCGFGVLYLLTYVLDVDATVINVVTVLGIGLSIDYGLLVVSRYREELTRPQAPDDGSGGTATRRRRRGGRGGTAHEAVVATVATAGRTVTFSALTVAISIATLAIFQPQLMRAIGLAGVAIILLALATALTLVPALLRMSGTRLARPGVVGRVPGLRAVLARTSDVSSDEGVFSRLAARVQRHPWLVVVGCVAVLGVLAAPAAGLQLRNSGIELLPTDSESRQFVAELSDEYPASRSPEVRVVVQGTETQGKELAGRIATLDGVQSVDPPAQGDGIQVIGVRTTDHDPGSAAVVDVVHGIRDLRDDGVATTFYVTGQAAGQVDFTAALADRLWWAVGIIALATFVLLALMTGSLVLPVKALLTNALSIFASLGVLVWVFQDGHLSGLLGFTSTGGIEVYVVALVLAFAFGLAMDYEVFLLSRIKELHDAGVAPRESVRLGLQRSGRIITSAAAIIIVVFAGFAAGRLLVTKEIGFALAVAVFIDATLVRMLLVPATMTLLGRANWWGPRWLKRLASASAVRP